MVQISALAKTIENELNGSLNAVALGVAFKIHSTLGNYTKAIKKTSGAKQVFVNGILRATNGEYTPVKALNNLDISLVLELAVQQARVEDVQLILSNWTEGVLGNVYDMGTCAVLITPQTTIAGVAKDASPIGSMVPLMLSLDVQLIENGLISNSVQWSINGHVVHPTSVATTNNRTPDTNPRANLGMTRSINQYDNETIVMTLPISFGAIIQTLLNDVRAHNIDATYQIIRDDGFSTNLNELYILGNAELAEEGSKIVAMTLTFVPADMAVSGFVLSFNSDGGSAIAEKEVYFGEPIGELSSPTKAGYVFAGWKIGDQEITSETIWLYNENKTAVAQWQSLDVTINVTPNYWSNHSLRNTNAIVTMTCETPDATIYYTEDGSVPDETSAIYTGAIEYKNQEGIIPSLPYTITVKARAIFGNTYGAVQSVTFNYGGMAPEPA